MEAHTRRIDLPEEKPEIFSCVLEFLCKTNTARASTAKLKVACGSLRAPAMATVAQTARIASWESSLILTIALYTMMAALVSVALGWSVALVEVEVVVKVQGS
jgi:hypothetical protein